MTDAGRKALKPGVAATFVAIAALAVLGVWLVNDSGRILHRIGGGQGLERYWLEIVSGAGATIAVVDFHMEPFSRPGYCLFVAEPEDIEKIVNTWSLQPAAASQLALPSPEGCSRLPQFSQGVRIYQEDRSHPLPTLPGNVSSSFVGLLYNPATRQGCVDLHYPYG